MPVGSRDYDVLIIGAGISGISAAYYVQTDCPSKKYAILEGRENFGGTWDLFKYPGIRSDSDMYTLGFIFRPWTSRKAIADGPDIMNYLEETIEEFGIDKHIQYGKKVTKAEWSSEVNRWTLEVLDVATGQTQVYTCNFLSMCTGYYNYDKGYTPDFQSMEDYQGQIIHPQKWPEDLDYTNKEIIVIGSGATAVTLVPELAKKAKHVTMLQRSPTYVVTGPSEDKIAIFMNRFFPKKVAYSFSRWRKILFQRFIFGISRRYPNFMKKLMIKGVEKELGKDYDVATHFTPHYKPWDQRVCLVPDSDLFISIKSGESSVVTDHIDRFTPKGLLLQSGKELEADIIVTATGLSLIVLAGIPFFVDGEAVDFAKTVSYKSMMFSNVPNMSLAIGYTNASWTLKCDLTSKYVARLLNFMDENGYTAVVPRQNDPDLELEPIIDFTSGYFQRSIDKFPKSGKKKPWRLKQNYLYDRMMIDNSKIDDGFLEFRKQPKKERVPEPVN